MSQTIEGVVKSSLKGLQLQTSNFVGDTLTPTQMQERLYVYGEVFASRFIPWLAYVLTQCRSEIARAACKDNLLCEINEDHPAMLRRFVAQSNFHPNSYARQRLESCRPILRSVTEMVESSPSWGLMVLAGLENASLAFIPVMRKWGEVLNFRDFEYVDKHGEADIAHADEFARAVIAEEEKLGSSLLDLFSSPALDTVTLLLKRIFV